jgi:hypothetical protein
MTAQITVEEVLRLSQTRLDEALNNQTELAEESLRLFRLCPAWTSAMIESVLGVADGWKFSSAAAQYQLCRMEIGTRRVWVDSPHRLKLAKRFYRSNVEADIKRVGLAVSAAIASDQTAADDPDDLFGQEAEVPSVVARWAELSQFSDDLLDETLRWKVHDSNLTEAEEWLRAGQALADVLQGALASTVRELDRSIVNRYAMRAEEKALQTFLIRPVQDAAVEDLLKGPHDQWALHVRGAGGLGKTMMIRHVIAQLAPGHRYAVGKVDFDLLSTDFPVKEPGQILNALASDLFARSGGAASEATLAAISEQNADTTEVATLRAFSGLVEDYARDVGASSLAELETSSPFMRLLYSFAELLSPFNGRVLLVLDTCEELARLRPGSTKLPQVEATLRILERVHELVPSVRVIFSGRRYLAQGGHGWKAPAGDAHASLPASRPYLKMLNVIPFEREEADRYLFELRGLDKVDPPVLTRDSSLHTAVLARCRSPKAVSGSTRDYYVPFDLSLYANWLSELTEDERRIRLDSTSIDPYVSQRLLGRIRHPWMRDAVPYAVVLERFDVSLLLEALHAEPDQWAEFTKELVQLEWLDVTHDPQRTLLAISPTLLPRLLKYFEVHEAERLQTVRTQLRVYLSAMAEVEGFGKWDRNTIASAARLMDPADFARHWDAYSQAVHSAASRDSLRQVSEHLLEAESGAIPPGNPLRAGVLASLALSTDQTSVSGDLLAFWREVDLTSGSYPSSRAEWLRRLATVFVQGSTLESGTPAHEFFNDLTRVVDPVTLACQLTVIERWLEVSTERGTVTKEQAQSLRNWAQAHADEPVIGDSLLVSAMRASCLAGDRGDAEGLVQDLLQRADRAPGESAINLPVWTPPANPRARIRLECLLYFVPGNLFTRDLISRWILDAVRDRFSADSERVASACLSRLYNLRYGLGLEKLADQVERFLVASEWVLPQPTCLSHRRTPPLFVPLARVFAKVRGVDEAIAICDRYERYSSESSTEPGARTWAAETVADLITLYGRRDLSYRIEKLGRFEVSSYARKAWRARALLTGTPAPGIYSDDEDLHSCFSTLGKAFGEVTAALERAFESSSGDPVLRQNLYLDLLEVDRLKGRTLTKRPPVDWETEKVLTQRPLQAEEIVRVELRRHALNLETVPVSLLIDIVGRIGLAEIAAQEAALLVNRLPKRAERLARLALHVIGRAGRAHVLRALGPTLAAEFSRPSLDASAESLPPSVETVTHAASSIGPISRNTIRVQGGAGGPFTGKSIPCTISLPDTNTPLNVLSPGVDAPSQWRQENSSILDRFGKWIDESGDDPEGVEIVSELPLAAEPWELALWLPSASRDRKRTVRSPVSAPRSNNPGQKGVEATFVSPQWVRAVQGASNGKATVLDQVAPVFKPPYRVLHLVARPHQTFGDYRLVFGDASQMEKQRQAQRKGPEKSTRLGVHVAPYDVPSRDCALIVLQQEPTLGTKRSRSDRLDMAALRAFGSELSSAGATYVLVLPSFSQLTALRCIELLAKELASIRPIRRGRLLDLVQMLRDIVLDQDPATAELGLEITLFASPNTVG